MRPLLRLCIVVTTLGLLAGSAFAQEGPKPGPEHEKLKAQEGDWDCVMEMGGAKFNCKSTKQMVLGGFWLSEKFEGDFGGTKIEGRGMTGYCPIKKKLLLTWYEMSPTPMTMVGDVKGNTTTWVGDGVGQDGKPAKFKIVYKQTDADNSVMDMFQVAGGKDNKIFTLTSKRKK